MFGCVQVDHELRQGAFKLCQTATQNDKPRTRKFGRSFKIHQPQFFADFEMFERLEIKLTWRPPAVDFDIIVFVFAHRHFRIQNVRERGQQKIKLVVQGCLPIFGFFDLVLERGHLGHQIVGVFTVLTQLSDFTGNHLATGQHFLMFGHQFTPLYVDIDQTLCGNVLFARSHCCVKSLGIFPNPFNVVHLTAPCQSIYLWLYTMGWTQGPPRQIGLF